MSACSDGGTYLHLTIYRGAAIMTPIFAVDVTFTQGDKSHTSRLREAGDASISIDPFTDANFQFMDATGKLSLQVSAFDEHGERVGKASAQEVTLTRSETTYLSVTLGDSMNDMAIDLPMTVDANDGSVDMVDATVADLVDLSPPPPDFSGVDFAATPNFAFITSTTYNGNLGGLDGADQICNARAQAARLPGSYVAWLSTSTVDAKTRLMGKRGWVRTDGKSFADQVTALSSAAGAILYPLNLDEFGHVVSLSAVVVTGTDASGRLDSNLACNDWTSVSNLDLATTGSTLGGSEAWTHIGGTSCNNPSMHIYCFENDRTVSVSVTPSVGRVAFLSSGTFDTSTGLNGADQQCQNEAAGASLIGTFKALLATQSASAASRMGLGATWQRKDGVVLAATANDFLDGTLFAPLNVSPSGTYFAPMWSVRTGSADARSTGIDTCVDWSTAASAAKSDVGVPADGAQWFRTPNSLTMLTCNQFARIYCLQQ